MASCYESLKIHFDTLIKGGYPKTNYLEPIRDTYENMFNKSLSHFDIYTSRLGFPSNPVKAIYTLVTEENYIHENEYIDGIMPCGDHIVCTILQSNDIFTHNPSEFILNSYINNIYQTMRNIVRMDRLYPTDSMARRHPYLAYLKSCPLYFTFHHCKTCFSDNIYIKNIITRIIEKYIVSNDEDADIVYESLMNHRYNPTPEGIYRAMSARGSVDLFG